MLKNKIIFKFVIILAAIICINNKSVFGLNDDFIFIIDTVGIPRYNAYGQEINEWVYRIYNVFVYDDPDAISSKDGQRWKAVGRRQMA